MINVDEFFAGPVVVLGEGVGYVVKFALKPLAVILYPKGHEKCGLHLSGFDSDQCLEFTFT